jgi:hypothetical protein
MVWANRPAGSKPSAGGVAFALLVLFFNDQVCRRNTQTRKQLRSHGFGSVCFQGGHGRFLPLFLIPRRSLASRYVKEGVEGVQRAMRYP